MNGETLTYYFKLAIETGYTTCSVVSNLYSVKEINDSSVMLMHVARRN
jgi:hypothetical protein